MGTSVNQGSPPTPSWQLATAILGDPDWPVARQSNELWQTAITDRRGELARELSHPLFAQACQIAASVGNPIDAIELFDDTLGNAYSAGVFFEAGKRALARSVAAGSGAVGFASELFAETAGYYVARDLPSVVGRRGRISTINEAISLKETIQNIARTTTTRIGTPQTDVAGWQAYVQSVLSALQSVGGHE